MKGIPRSHAGIIGTRADVLATHNASLSMWSVFNVATHHLSHEVDVNPGRERTINWPLEGAILAPQAHRMGSPFP